MTKQIPLTQGRFALVDDADYEWLSRFGWYFDRYARRSTRQGEFRGGIRMHREILNAPAHMQVDHRNGNRLDNQRSNLRLATATENARNKKVRSGGSSRYKGVHVYRDGWRAAATIGNTNIYLGYFTDEAEAARAYDNAAREYFGDFARLNFPPEEQSQ